MADICLQPIAPRGLIQTEPSAPGSYVDRVERLGARAAPLGLLSRVLLGVGHVDASPHVTVVSYQGLSNQRSNATAPGPK